METNMEAGRDAERSGADISDNGRYRYALWRRWAASGESYRRFIVIGLNPSTADATQDDPTIRRCIGFAKREGCGQLVMLNLFAFRATDPRVMKAYACPVGPDNDTALIHWCAPITGEPDPIVVAAWGAHGSHLNRAREVRNLLEAALVELRCFGRTSTGAPKHPLYLKADTPLIDYAA